jgi:hypothetical protein
MRLFRARVPCLSARWIGGALGARGPAHAGWGGDRPGSGPLHCCRARPSPSVARGEFTQRTSPGSHGERARARACGHEQACEHGFAHVPVGRRRVHGRGPTCGRARAAATGKATVSDSPRALPQSRPYVNMWVLGRGVVGWSKATPSGEELPCSDSHLFLQGVCERWQRGAPTLSDACAS